MTETTYDGLNENEVGTLERIFRRDADRTVLEEVRRVRFIETVRLCNWELRDYSQGGQGGFGEFLPTGNGGRKSGFHDGIIMDLHRRRIFFQYFPRRTTS